MILNNVELRWARLDPANPDTGFDGTACDLSAMVITRDKAEAGRWKEAKMNVKTEDDDQGIFWFVKLRKPMIKKDGSKAKPVPVVGRDLMPLEDVSIVGNGTIANVKVHQFDYNFNGRQGVSTRLDAIQIVELKIYERSGAPAGLGFSNLDSASPVEESSSEDEVY